MANAGGPDGTYTSDPTTGTDSSTITGVTNGTCDAPGTATEPVDGFNAFVVGPSFPKSPPSKPNGLIIVGTTDAGFSTTDPIHFAFRKSFKDLAQEQGVVLQAGDYIVTFRCINQFDNVVFQTFTQTFRFTGGPPAKAYTVINLPPGASPSPGVSPSPSPSPGVSPSPSPTPTDSPTSTPNTTPDSTPTTTSEGAGATTSSDPPAGTQPVASTGTLAKTGAPIAIMFLGGLTVLAAGLGLVVWLKRPRRAALSDGEDTPER